MPEQLDGILLTHEHGDHICGLEVLCRKFDVPIYCNSLTAEAVRSDSSFEQHRNWRIFATGAEFSICDITVQTFPVPHDAVDPLGFAFYAGASGPRVYHRSRLRDQDDRRTITPGANARDRDQSRRKTFAERHASALAGETTNPIATWSSVERSCSRRHRGIVAWKNRAGCARTSQPGLQHAGASAQDGARVTGKVRQDRRGNPLRHPIGNHSAISHR